MITDYAAEVLKGSPRALARVISWLENEDKRAAACMEKLYPHTGNAHIIGITGSPGAGKSSVTNKLTQSFRSQGLTVGIIAVDPTSPFTGGALLGDRVRMNDLATDKGVFIRSMATRGFLGGLTQVMGSVVKVMDASGKDIIIIETVGVGQDEVDIVRVADTTCLVLVPGYGDIIQSMKAGVMEIADIYVINKYDNPGADQLFAEVSHRVNQDTLIKHSKNETRAWTPLVTKTVAIDPKKGVAELFEAIQTHQHYLEQHGNLLEMRKARVREETLQMIHYELFRLLKDKLSENGRMENLVEAIIANQENPYHAMHQVIAEFIRS
jgi:LAO/AO transport system kinase